jgi:hypothetical protein
MPVPRRPRGQIGQSGIPEWRPQLPGGYLIKYQSLAFKLALLPADPAALIADGELLKLLRDR